MPASRERQRLALEMHDSVTQTIFSMTLTTQSALLLLERDRRQVAGQLDWLEQLAQSALGEMQELISHLAPQMVVGGDVAASLQRHLQERRQPLNPTEEARLFRIAQETLNNIIKHAGVSQAAIRLHLGKPAWMDIEDHGVGFDSRQAWAGAQLKLAGLLR